MSAVLSATATHSDSRPPVILIGGGVGPAAGVKFHDMLLRLTPGVTADRDHLDLIHFGRVSDMPDRTGFLNGGDTDNPGPAMARYMAPMARALTEEGRAWVAAVPCCTFHTPAIFDAFATDMAALPGHGTVLNLITETVADARALAGAPQRIGILSTRGSRRMGTWATPLTAAGLDPVELSLADADWMHDAIYHPGYGLKAVMPPDPRAVDAILRGWEMLRARGAEVLILGCTELSLVAPALRAASAGVPVVLDPIEVLAQRCVTLGQRPVTLAQVA